MPADKSFKNVIDQIRLLRSRGLQINNFQSAKKNLLDKNYFNLINGFETLLLDDSKKTTKKYSKKSFDDFIRLHDFDIQLSTRVLQKISEFETKLKTSIAYHFCKNHCSTLLENNNYIDVNCYNIPKPTEGKKEYVNFFYNKDDPKKTHKLFRKNYYFEGNFRGTFTGNVTFTPKKSRLDGVFKGRFGSTSIREVDGTCTFFDSKQPSLKTLLQAATSTSGTVTISLRIKNERIYGLSYIDECKTKFPYINEYNNPPFWVVIKTLMLNDLIILMYGLKKRTFEAVLKEFNLKPHDREIFLNSLEIIRELRNACAHFELINYFKTPQNLSINARLISKLSLTPVRSQYIIKLYDVLKVLRMYVDLYEIKSFVWDYWYLEKKSNNTKIAIALLEQMGNSNIDDWI